MADLLPSLPDTSTDDPEPRVVGLDSEDADDLLAALSSTTARELFAGLHESPSTASELAERAGTSLQNTQYHLEKLSDAGLIEVVDTAYSEKGREMDVYAPADKPLVFYAGADDKNGTLRTALSRLLGGVGVLAVASLVVDQLVDSPQTGVIPEDSGFLGNGEQQPVRDIDATTTDPETVQFDAPLVDGATGLPPGLLFFLGGALVLCCTLALWHWRGLR